MKLERFDKNKKYKKIALLITLLVIGFISGIFLFNSFAYFEETKSFNIIEGKVPTIRKGDIKLAVVVDGSSASEFPSKENHKYVEDENACTNGASITWDSDNWELTLKSNTPTVCTLKFVSIRYKYKITTEEGEEIETDIIPEKKGHKYTGHDCTPNSTSIEWDTNNWTVTNVNYTETSVCTINFETLVGVDFVEYLQNTGDLKEFNHSATDQTGSNTPKDYRYTGKDPNNYVEFNDELWRIIGIFKTQDENGNYAWRVKLIRNLGVINGVAWDENGTNNWTKASLMNILNNEQTGAYFRREGDYADTGLTDDAKSQIDSVKWYLGGTNAIKVLAEDYYKIERGNTVYTGNSTSWVGKVGLMYPSDYGFASTGTNCQNIDISTWCSLTNENKACCENDWIFYGNKMVVNENVSASHTWTITHNTSSAVSVTFFQGTGYGFISSTARVTGYMVRPCVYLKSDILMLDGTGSSTDPYILSVE